MVRRTKEEAQATRTLLLDTAERVFQQRGVSRTTLNEIATAAGLTRGAIYWHFKDKADLFDAMMQRVTLPLEETLQFTREQPFDDPLGAIRHCFDTALGRTVNDPQVRRVFEIATHKVEYVDELLAVRDRHLAKRQQCLDHLQRQLGAAMRSGQLSRRMPARAAAMGLHALMAGLIQDWMLDPQAFDLVKVGRQALEAYLTGLV